MTTSLPVAGASGAHGLPGDAVRYWNLRTAISSAVVVALGAGAVLWSDATWVSTLVWFVVVPIAVLGAVVDVVYLNRKQFEHYSYTVTPDFVYVVKGRLLRRSLTIATPQILNVETMQGPLLRSFGLVQLKFTCIVDVDRIGPLTPARAEEIRSVVLHIAVAVDAT